MYAKNNPTSLTSLSKLHSNALMKSQSPTTFKFKPLSQIQNSLEKVKARKKRSSKSKSRSKENTPQNDMSAHNGTSIGSHKKSTLFKNFQQDQKQTINFNPKKAMPQFTGNINSTISSMNNIYTKTPSELSINSKNLTQSNTSSCVSSQYQLPISSICSQKGVKFSDKHVEINMSRINSKKLSNQEDQRKKTPSILKNKISNSVNTQRSSSIKSISKLTKTKTLTDLENLSSNKLIRAKYEAMVKKYEDINKRYGKNQVKNYNKLQKYTDDILPPHDSSIFSYSIHSKTQKPKANIIWKRIPQLYQNIQTLIVLREQFGKSLIKVSKRQFRNYPSLAEDYFVNSLNCIRENKTLLEKMFEINNINIHGVYLIKIFQQNSWKYVIVDDLIPTIYDESKQIYVSAFINVQKAEGNSIDTIEIWPYLLEKAYAAYYSKFMALKHGKQIDFLSELTGVTCRKIQKDSIDFKNNQHLQIQALLREEKGIIFGQKVTEDKSSFFCILPDLNCITKKSQGYCTYLTKQKSYKPIRQKLQSFLSSLTNLYIYELQVYQNIHSSYLCPQTKKTTVSLKNKKQKSQENEQNETTLRCFTVTQKTRAIISIRQKDCRFYYQAKIQYKYIWIRAIVLLKEFNGDYRWIQGFYSNEKSLNFFLKLQPGEYYLLLMPQWNPSYKYDLSINFYTESFPVTLQKKPYLASEQIFEKGCTDIAQRQGSMHQINKFICAYNYVSESIGLVIENINNERQSGPVTVMRSINGLKCQVDIVAVNKEFYFCANSDYDNQTGKTMKKTIQVDINANEHYTVVLKTVGGIDHKFFQSFDFGS